MLKISICTAPERAALVPAGRKNGLIFTAQPRNLSPRKNKKINKKARLAERVFRCCSVYNTLQSCMHIYARCSGLQYNTANAGLVKSRVNRNAASCSGAAREASLMTILLIASAALATLTLWRTSPQPSALYSNNPELYSHIPVFLYLPACVYNGPSCGGISAVKQALDRLSDAEPRRAY